MWELIQEVSPLVAYTHIIDFVLEWFMNQYVLSDYFLIF